MSSEKSRRSRLGKIKGLVTSLCLGTAEKHLGGQESQGKHGVNVWSLNALQTTRPFPRCASALK